MINGTKTINDLEEELHLSQAKLAAIERKELALLKAEGQIRTDMQRIENQIFRLKTQTQCAEESPQNDQFGGVVTGCY